MHGETIKFVIDLHNLFTRPHTHIKLKHIITQETDKIIKLLKTNNSRGYDEISTEILKASAPYILSPLTYIGDKILSTRIFPDRLKFSKIKPLFKKGDTTNFSNYFRPPQRFLRKLFTKDCTNI